MDKAKIRPLATPKPLNRSLPKLPCVITSWTAVGVQNFLAIGLRVSAPEIRDFAKHLGWLVFCSFFGFFNKATAYILERIFTQNTSKDVVPGKEVPFGGLDDYIFYLDLSISEKPPFWGPILSFFATENRFNMGMLQYRTTLNRHRSPIKVV